MTRWVQEGYWGRFFLRLSEDGLLQFQIPMPSGRWRLLQVDLTPGDGGGARLTTFEKYDNDHIFAPGVVPGGVRLPGSPAPTAYGVPVGGEPPRGSPSRIAGGPPQARLVDVLRSYNDGPDITEKPPPSDDEP